MVRVVATGIGSVMRLSYCLCRQSLNVRIAAFAAAMVSVRLAVERLSHLAVRRCMAAIIFTCLVTRRCGIDFVW